MSIPTLAERVSFVRIRNGVAERQGSGRRENTFGCGARANAGRAKARAVSKRVARVLPKGNVESTATNKRRSEEQSHCNISGF